MKIILDVEKLIWGADFDGDDYGCGETYSIVSTLTCPKCESYVEVYYPKEKKKNEDNT